jgi:hypothetical protein
VSLSWVTPSFELYCVGAAGANRATLAKGATTIAAWVKREEERLFVIGGAVCFLYSILPFSLVYCAHQWMLDVLKGNFFSEGQGGAGLFGKY